ncbi:MAG: thioredoxin-like domain-containing protein [Candidatus Sumerlaeia bacterium]
MKRLLPARPEELVGISMARGPEVTRRLKRVIARIDNSPLTRRAVALFFLATAISITTLAGLRVVHAGEASLPPANKINPADVPPGARVLHFPADRVLGLVYIDRQPLNSRSRNTGGHLSNVDAYEWQLLSPARGDVVIPPGKLAALLILPPVVFQDLSPLSRLGPDDLYQVSIRHWPTKEMPVGFDPNTLLAPLKDMTGLKSLDIAATTIGTKGLRTLPAFKSLERLTMPRNVTDTGVAVACQLRTLKVLQVGGERAVTDSCFDDLANLAGLEELHISGHSLRGNTLSKLCALKSLHKLFINGNLNETAAMTALSRFPALRSLNLFSYPLTDRGMAILADSPTIEEILLHWDDKLTDVGAASMGRMRSLKKVDLWNARALTNRGVEALCRARNLESVDLEANSLDDDALIALAQLPRIRRAELVISYSTIPGQNKPRFTERGLAALAAKPTMRELGIGGSGINDAALAQIARMTNLTDLHLSPLVTATNTGFARLGALKSLEQLTVFNYSDAVTIAGLKRLGSLPRLKNAQFRDFVQDYSMLDLSGMPNLEMLLLSVRSGQMLHDGDMTCFAGMNRMRRLDLTRAGGVTDEGLRHIAGMTGLETMLRLDTSRLTDAGMKTFSAMQLLKSLDIGGDIGDAGLAEIAKMSSLTSLRLTTTAQISPAGVDALKALPFLTACNIGSPQTSNPAAVGKDVEDIKYTSLAGRQMKLSEMKKVVMVHFWSTWDKPCLDRAELERLSRINDMMSKKYPGKFALISMALDGNDALWRETVKREGMTWLQGRLNSNSHYAYSYGIKSLPAYFLLTPGGKVLLNPESSWKDLDAAMAKGLGKTLRIDGYMKRR